MQKKISGEHFVVKELTELTYWYTAICLNSCTLMLAVCSEYTFLSSFYFSNFKFCLKVPVRQIVYKGSLTSENISLY